MLNFWGNNSNNRISATSRDDYLAGFGGNDTLLAGAGDDTLSGGTGNDLLYGEWGDDVFYGGSGYDRYYGGPGSDIYYGRETRGYDINIFDGQWGWDIADFRWALEGIQLGGAAGRDATLINVEEAHLSSFDDLVLGTGDLREVFGRGGDDVIVASSFGPFGVMLNGGAGNDRLSGGIRNDTLDGGEGKDHLSGGGGLDRLTGGADADVFRFSDRDDLAGVADTWAHITDFDAT